MGVRRLSMESALSPNEPICLVAEDLAIFKKVDSQESYDQLFRGYDRDADGTITFKEYLEYHLGIVFSEPDELFDSV